MNREPFDESLLTAYLDDELSHDDRNKVESALRESPQLTKLLEQLRIVRKLVTSAVRCEEKKLAGADATTLADDGQPSFTIKGPWQSAAVTKPTDTSPAMVATKRVDPVVAATHDQAFHRALRGWMMLASLAATVLLGLFVFSPWKSKRESPIASAPSASPAPINAEKMPSARMAVAPPADVAPGMPVPSDPAPKDASLSNHFGIASDALINLLAEASAQTDRNRGEFDAMARSPKLQELESLAKKQSSEVDKSSPPNEANTEEPSYATRSADTPRFVFVLNPRVDSVPFADAKGSVAADAAATGVGLGSVQDAPGVPPRDILNAPNHGEPSNRSWALAALDRPEPGEGPSSQLVIEFRFPNDREEQAIVALRELGIVLPAETLKSDLSKQGYFGELDDSQNAIFERVESRFVDRNKNDPKESKALQIPQRTKGEFEPIQGQWRSIRILLRRRVSEPE